MYVSALWQNKLLVFTCFSLLEKIYSYSMKVWLWYDSFDRINEQELVDRWTDKWVDAYSTLNVKNFVAISELLIQIFINYMRYCKHFKTLFYVRKIFHKKLTTYSTFTNKTSKEHSRAENISVHGILCRIQACEWADFWYKHRTKYHRPIYTFIMYTI
jgi:hypothetical protein